jgi:hypothetical protein
MFSDIYAILSFSIPGSCLTLYVLLCIQGTVGSSHDEVDCFSLPNPSSRTMALGSTQPLIEMNTRNLSGG